MDGAADREPPADAAGHMAAAAVARAAGDVDAVRASLAAAFAAARAAGDRDAMATAALALPTSQRFGAYPGQIPALLHEVYATAEAVSTRSRLAAALARSWVYGGDAARAARFADEAQRLAAEAGDPDGTADALDAALLAHWGPDDFSQRLSLAARLDDVVAHVADTDLRLSAHLWRLTTAWECLDIVAVQRQLRALDVVAEESGSRRAAFYAASRRAMHALATDDPVAADRFIARTADLGAQLAEPDVEAVLHELRAMQMRIAGDAVGLRSEAAAGEAFGAAQGIPSVSAAAAGWWLAAGEPDRAALLVSQLTAGGVDGIARDVDFLLTVTCIVGVAADIGLVDVAREYATALEPYAGRGVVNAGAVTFQGVVDDYLYRACRATGEADANRWRQTAQHAYARIGARWWERGLGVSPARATRAARHLSLRRDDTGRWSVGADGTLFALADLRGLHYLRYLLERPGVDVEALTLSAAAYGHPHAKLDEADMGEVLDAAALAAYRLRLAELDEHLDAADLRGDQDGAEVFAAERAALIDELRKATGVGGRARRVGASSERARIAVRKAIAAALTQIDQHDPSVARLLRDSVRTGTSCRYDPNPDHPVTWITG